MYNDRDQGEDAVGYSILRLVVNFMQTMHAHGVLSNFLCLFMKIPLFGGFQCKLKEIGSQIHGPMNCTSKKFSKDKSFTWTLEMKISKMLVR